MTNCVHNFCVEWLKSGLGELNKSSHWQSSYETGCPIYRLRCQVCGLIVKEGRSNSVEVLPNIAVLIAIQQSKLALVEAERRLIEVIEKTP